MRRSHSILAACLALTVMCCVVAWWPSTEVTAHSAAPASSGCQSCHEDSAPSDAVHAGIACTSCHLGDAKADVVPLAHLGLEAEPGALETAPATCGACHPTEHARVQTSLMTTNAGLVSVDRWAFGELPAPHGHQTITEVLAETDPTPGEDHLRKLCGGCHLGTRRDNRDDAIVGTGSGCGACHVDTRGEGHPGIEPLPSDHQCTGCHSRSSRISLSYRGQFEVGSADACDEPATLVDGRTVCQTTPDVHHTAGLSCIDCHVHTALMGDGELHAHKEEQVEVTCESCHAEAEGTTWADVRDPITERILRLRGEDRPPTEAVRTAARGTPLWNLRPAEGGTWWLQPKRGGEPVAVSTISAGHVDDAHSRLSCSACHAPHAPLCVECHTAFDPNASQWDFGTGGLELGAWRESSSASGVGVPLLGVDAGDRIVPVVPGMQLHLTLPDGTERTVNALAPASPHTTAATSRTCASCHTTVEHPPTPSPPIGTRVGFRALSDETRARIQAVGTCLGCHPETDPMYRHYKESVERVSRLVEAGEHPQAP